MRDYETVIIWPAQCSCGHVFLETYTFSKPNKDGEVGFCWCGFCRTKRMVKPYIPAPTGGANNGGAP